MSARIITIAQHKGGAGKTTLTTQLAASFDAQGEKVLILDLDPQASSTEWHMTRAAKLGRKNKIDLEKVQTWKLMRELPELAARYDVILIDTPPHAESESSTAIRLAHMVLIPLQPSPLDIWACGPTLQIALTEKKPLMLVLNRVPPRAKLNETIMEKLDKMNIQVARTTLGNRVAYASSIMQGLGVVESDPSSSAALEIKALTKELARSKVFKGLKAA